MFAARELIIAAGAQSTGGSNSNSNIKKKKKMKIMMSTPLTCANSLELGGAVRVDSICLSVCLLSLLASPGG